jgi:hypothetical protein
VLVDQRLAVARAQHGQLAVGERHDLLDEIHRGVRLAAAGQGSAGAGVLLIHSLSYFHSFPFTLIHKSHSFNIPPSPYPLLLFLSLTPPHISFFLLSFIF